MRPRFAYLDHAGPLAIAHRGGASERPENTAVAFSHAFDLGYRWMETDVRASADGEVVVIHDPVLDRLAGRPGRVSELPWSELRHARVAGAEPLPLLADLLAAWPDVRWNVDAKDGAVVAPLVKVLRRGGALERVCVTSFSDRRVARVRRLTGPELCTGAGRRAVAALRAASLLPGAPLLGPWREAGAAQVPPRWGRVPVVDRPFLAAAHRRGLVVHVWTVDEEAEMDRLLDLGVDGVMTDRPTLLKSVLRRRGVWD